MSLWQSGELGAPTGIQPTIPSPLIKRRAAMPSGGGIEVSPLVVQQIQGARGTGNSLPLGLKPSLEASFGMDFSEVRLHTDERADTLNRSLQARAFTTGQDIFFRQGEYSPGTVEGMRLLGHELGHVGQQKNTGKSVQRQAHEEGRRTGHIRANPGVHIRWSGQQVYVHANMQLLGTFQNTILALQMKQIIERFWTQSFSDGYQIWCTANIYVLPNGQTRRSYTSIYVEDLTRPTYVHDAIMGNGRFMMFDIDDIDTWTAAHEFGHILGLPDRYTESIFSRISGLFGGERHTPPIPGWEGNLMAEVGGELESRNVRDLRLYAGSS